MTHFCNVTGVCRASFYDHINLSNIFIFPSDELVFTGRTLKLNFFCSRHVFWHFVLDNTQFLEFQRWLQICLMSLKSWISCMQRTVGRDNQDRGEAVSRWNGGCQNPQWSGRSVSRRKRMIEDTFKACERIYFLNPEPDIIKQSINLGVCYMRYHQIMGEIFYMKGEYQKAITEYKLFYERNQERRGTAP